METNGILQGGEIAVGDVPEAVGQRLERLVLFRLAGRGQRREGAPMERPQRRDDDVAPGPPLRRASLMAHSLASAPELAKNTLPPAGEPSPDQAVQSHELAARRGSLSNRFDTCRAALGLLR